MRLLARLFLVLSALVLLSGATTFNGPLPIPIPNAYLAAPDRSCGTVCGGGTSAVVGDMGGQVNLTAGASGFTISAIGSGVWTTGSGSLIIVNGSGSAQTITNTATVNGPCGGSTFSVPNGGFCYYLSNGASLDSAGGQFSAAVAGNNTWSGSNTFQGAVLGLDVQNATTTITLDNTVTCGQEIFSNDAGAVTATLNSTFPAQCTVVISQQGAGAVTVSAGTGTLHKPASGACSTGATRAQYSAIRIKSSATAGTAYLSGDCT